MPIFDPNVATPSVFGGEYATAEEVTETSTTSQTYQTKITLNFTPQATATYRIAMYAEVRQGTANRYIRTKLSFSLGTLIEQKVLTTTNIAGVSVPSTGFDYWDLVSGTAYAFVLQFCCDTNGGTAYIKNARIEIWRAT